MEIIMSEQHRKPNGKKRLTKKQRRKRKIIMFAVELIVLVILLVCLFIWAKLNLLNNTGEMKNVEVNELDETTKELLNGYTNIALFGVDNRSNGNYSAGNSDCIMVASINNDTKEVKLTSIFRDTYLDIDNKTFRKVNSAYNKGGAEQAVNVLNKNLDLDIEQYVSADFNAVTEVVDALGGIELDITDEEAAVMNGQTGHEDYIQENMEVTGKTSSHVSGGLQTVDGIQATAYCRVRYTSGDDFKRTERQRTVISKIVEKAKTADIATLNTIINEVFPDIETSLSNTEILGLAANVMDYELVDTQGWPFMLTTTSVGSKGDVVVATDLETNVSLLHRYLFEDEDYTPSNTVQGLSDEISYETGTGPDDAIIDTNPFTTEDTESSEVSEVTE